MWDPEQSFSAAAQMRSRRRASAQPRIGATAQSHSRASAQPSSPQPLPSQQLLQGPRARTAAHMQRLCNAAAQPRICYASRASVQPRICVTNVMQSRVNTHANLRKLCITTAHSQAPPKPSRQDLSLIHI